MDYYDEYIDYIDPETGIKYDLRHKRNLYGVPDESWQLSGMTQKMSPLDYGGHTTDSSIFIGIHSSGVYVDDNYYDDPKVDRYLDDIIMKNVGNDVLKASNLLHKAESTAYLKNFDVASKLAHEAKNIFSLYKNDRGIIQVDEFLEKINEDHITTEENIIKNKKRIHRAIYEDYLIRCPLFGKKLDATCNVKEEIEEIIKNPIIYGFFMYQFPKKKIKIYKYKAKKQNEQYTEELLKLKEIIRKINENPLIEIKFPNEVTGLDVKTCDFCKISRTYDFGLLLLSPPNPNAYLEAGMFISLGKKVVLLNNESINPDAPFDLTPFFYIHYDNINEIEDQWNRKMPDFFDNLIKNYTIEFMEYEFKRHDVPNSNDFFYLEIISKFKAITPFCIGVDIDEKFNVIKYMHGPSNIVPEIILLQNEKKLDKLKQYALAIGFLFLLIIKLN